MTIQSAIYLSGNKKRLWKDIKPHLEGKSILIDLFTGSGTIVLNATNEKMFDKVIANDSCKHLIGLHNALKGDYFLDMVAFSNECYGNSKEEYLRLREDYNTSKRLDLLLNLNYRSNSNMMRWNKSGGFNMPYGERSCYKEDRLLQHKDLCQNIEFHNEDFVKLVYQLQKEVYLENCTVYIDSPYSNTTATYNEGGGWPETQDKALLTVVEYFQSAGAKVVMSNVFRNRGKENTWLIDWCEENKDKFDVHKMNISYNNSSFRKSKEITEEVLIVSKP